MKDVANSDQRDSNQDLENARGRYWRAVVQLQVNCHYAQGHSERLDTILTRISVIRAIASVGALGGWFSGIGEAKLWGAVIVFSQVFEAVVDRLPLSSRARALRNFVPALDALLIDAFFEWDEEVNAVDATAKDVRRRWHKLMSLQHEIENSTLGKVGLPYNKYLFQRAEDDTLAYLQINYGVTSVQ